MPILYRPLRSHELLDLSAPDDSLHVCHGGGRNLQLAVPSRWISFWLPLKEGVELEAPDCRWLLRPGELLVWRDGPLQAGNRRDGRWLAVCGSPAAWARYQRARPGEPAIGLLPSESRCTRALRRLGVRLARVARRPELCPLDVGAVAGMLSAALTEHQRDLHALLPRCAGRTLLRRQQTLMRLLRVRHLIRRHDEGRVDLAQLAASANYSPCHLIRSYRDVFGETPSEYAARLRSERAWQLVRETRMPVCEITAALGFESQSAFCRAFKGTFGMTTTQARRLADPVPLRAGTACAPEMACAQAA
ncbi:helix-turn-helix transcriptional regulator [Luteimonas sp. SJ-92]|uniref:Helix-turn-helix transcriptional regulator n=1 Tax=Luteimonas salinisoli TaxID=2752307 RepID=A0A853JDJ2_9GAMM|nr:helix-turn-helix domain-containing protein [Luteimonas salinisoli]NZA26677.1 helix-turn-helix transcriptional regulator [Luteimonas salinisoli]